VARINTQEVAQTVPQFIKREKIKIKDIETEESGGNPAGLAIRTFEKQALVVLEAVELVGNPQGCPSGGRVTAKQLSTGAANPQLIFSGICCQGIRELIYRRADKMMG
jgi:hypothetical protein